MARELSHVHPQLRNQLLGSPLADSGQNSSSRYSQHITGNAGELDVGVFQDFLYSVGGAGTLLDQSFSLTRRC
jgi:hypothetical protein